jgi:hypothetical protein
MSKAKLFGILFLLVLFSGNSKANNTSKRFNSKAVELELECEDAVKDLNFINERGFFYNNSLILLLNAHLIERFSDEVIKSKLGKWGFPTVTIVERKKTGMRFFVAANDDMALVIFRGTVVLRSWISNAFFNQKSAKIINMPGTLHSGFLKTFHSIKNDLIKVFNKMNLWHKPIYFSGHSMGGAHALMSALWLKAHGADNIVSIYTTAQPRIGDATFMEYAKKIFSNNYYRVLIDYDLTPQVPPTKEGSKEFAHLISERMPGVRTFFHKWVKSLNYAPHINDPYIMGKEGVLNQISQAQEISREKSFWVETSKELSIRNPIIWYKTLTEHFDIHAPNKYICKLEAPFLYQ